MSKVLSLVVWLDLPLAALGVALAGCGGVGSLESRETKPAKTEPCGCRESTQTDGAGTLGAGDGGVRGGSVSADGGATAVD